MWKDVKNLDSTNIKKKWNEYDQLFKIKTNPKEQEQSDWIDKAFKILSINLLNTSGISSFERINGKIRPSIIFNNIDEVTKYFLKKSIVIGKSEYKECRQCGRIFEAVHARSRFCPPPPLSKMIRSACENAYNQKEKRIRKKESTKKLEE